jgi:predicted TIM-barrel fold metal-dependent hydrolase
MFDGFAHLDLTTDDPLRDISARLDASGGTDALLVETWKGEDFHILDLLRVCRQERFQLAFCFRPGKPLMDLLTDPSVFGIRIRGSELGAAPDVADYIKILKKHLVVHSDQGIGPLADGILRALDERPTLKVYLPHLGWPTVGGKEDPDWNHAILKLAARPTVVIGISAISHFSNDQFPHPDVKRYAQEIMKSFEPHRIIAGSDYPLIDKDRYADYMALARDWIREMYPEW